MTKKEKMIENLARDLCWAGFFYKPADHTKKSYWKSISQDARNKYIYKVHDQLSDFEEVGLKRYEKILTLISK